MIDFILERPWSILYAASIYYAVNVIFTVIFGGKCE